MTRTTRFTLFITVFMGVFSCKPASLSLPEDIADAYGLAQFDEIKSIAYTFHVKKGAKKISRKWKWYPHDKKVELIKPDGVITYNRTSVLSDKLKVVDAQFVNDNYWLLFPFHLKWSRDNMLTYVQEKATAPISNQACKMLTVVFNNDDGYTPGDAYDLYLTEKNKIIEWSFRKGAQKAASLTTTWSSPEDFNGIQISTAHKNNAGSFQLWFDEIAIK